MHDEQADIVEGPVVTSNPTRSARLEPIITSCSEQVTFVSRFKSADYSINALCSQLIFIISAGLQYFRPALLWSSIIGSECTECRSAATTATDYNYKSASEYQGPALCSNYCSSWWFQWNKEHLQANRIPTPGTTTNQALASQQSSVLPSRSE